MRRFKIEDVFSMNYYTYPNSIILCGHMIKGDINIGDIVILPDGNMRRVLNIEFFRKKVDSANENDNIGILIAEVTDKKSDITERQYINSFLKEEVNIVDISELRDMKISELGI